MNWLINQIVNLLSWMFGGGGRQREELRAREGIYNSAQTRETILGNLAETDDVRESVVQTIGPSASSDGTAFSEDKYKYADENGVLTSIRHIGFRRCDCGGLLGHGNSTIGTCSVCGRVLCNQEGCSAGRCERCGLLICTRHASRQKGHVFCSRCRPVGWWLRFWGVLK